MISPRAPSPTYDWFLSLPWLTDSSTPRWDACCIQVSAPGVGGQSACDSISSKLKKKKGTFALFVSGCKAPWLQCIVIYRSDRWVLVIGAGTIAWSVWICATHTVKKNWCLLRMVYGAETSPCFQTEAAAEIASRDIRLPTYGSLCTGIKTWHRQTTRRHEVRFR